MMRCPVCGFNQQDAATCKRCGSSVAPYQASPVVTGTTEAASSPSKGPHPTRTARRYALFILAVLVVSLVIFFSRRFPPPNIPIVTGRVLSAADLYNKVYPAIVVIQPEEESGEVSGLGSGFIIDKEGTVVTNYHVVQGAARLHITLADGRTLLVNSLIGFDGDKDLALFRVSVSNPPIIEIEREGRAPTIGEKVYAIGNPKGLQNTLSEGLVSGVRSAPPWGDLIQTTASVGPGSSGGPLLNEKGKAIGVIVFLLREGQNLNFAIPAAALLALAAKGYSPTPLAGLPETENRKTMKEQVATAAVLAIIQGRTSEGYVMAEELIRKWPDFGRAWYAKGYALQEMGENVQAVEALNRALNLSPQLNEAYFPLGLALFNLTRYDEAIEAFGNSNRYAVSETTYFNIGLSYLRLDKKRRAIENFEEAVRLKPEFAEAHYMICESYVAMGDVHTAVIMCERTIRYDPRHVEARYLLGQAYIQLGEYEKAYSHMAVLSSLDPAKARLLESALQAVARRRQAALLGGCLSNAQATYEANWNSTCRRLGNLDRCTLPILLADELNKDLRRMEDGCYRGFPQR